MKSLSLKLAVLGILATLTLSTHAQAQQFNADSSAQMQSNDWNASANGFEPNADWRPGPGPGRGGPDHRPDRGGPGRFPPPPPPPWRGPNSPACAQRTSDLANAQSYLYNAGVALNNAQRDCRGNPTCVAPFQTNYDNAVRSEALAEAARDNACR